MSNYNTGLMIVFFSFQIFLFGLSTHKFDFKPSPRLQSLVDTLGNVTDIQWTGGDCSCSTTIEFGEKKYELFFYADSSLGEVYPNRTRKSHMRMVHNTVGVYDFQKNEHIGFFWRPGPESFFQSNNDSVYFWSAQSISFSDSPDQATVYVFLFRTLKKGFLEQDGMTIAEIKVNSTSILNPLSWDEIIYHQLPFEISSQSNKFNWGGMAVTKEDDKIYLWGNLSGDQKKSFLSRLTVDNFRNFYWEKMEFYCSHSIFFFEKGKWITLGGKQFKDMKLKPIPGLPGNPESFIFYHSFLKKYVSIMIPGFLSSDVHIYLSDSITGHFEGEKVWEIPPPWSTTKNLFSYALKSHQSLCGDDGSGNCIVFTYNTNCFDCSLGDLVHCFTSYKEFYIPQFVKVSM